MDTRTIGRLIARHRRARGLSLRALAATAGVGRSTLAALESGELDEVGYAKVERICRALGLTLDVREPPLAGPLMVHRHLTEKASRELTKAAIEDIILRGEIDAWRGLVKAIRNDETGCIADRVRKVATALCAHDSNAKAFAALMPYFERNGSRKLGAQG